MAGGRGAGGSGGPAPRMRHLHHGELLLRVAARQGVVLLVWKINRENINNFTNLKKNLKIITIVIGKKSALILSP